MSGPKRQIRWILMACALVCAGGCGKKKTSVAENVGAAVSDAEARTFADGLTKAAKAGDAATVSSALDLDAIGEVALADLQLGGDFLKGFNNGMRSAMQSPQGFGGQIVKQVSEGGSFELLRIVNRGGKRATRMRLIMGEEGGVNYMDFVLARRKDGSVRAVDLYNFMTSELTSQTIRRAAIPIAAQQNRGILARLAGAESDYAEHYAKLKDMSAAIAQGQGKQALTIFDTLPDSLKKDKTFLIIRIRAASLADEPTYMAAMEDYRRAFPDDPAADFISIDYFLLRKDYDKSLQLVDRLDKAVGGDPYLDVVRAGVLISARRPGPAKEAAQRYATAEPDKPDGPTALLNISLLEKNHAETLRLLNLLEKKFGVRFNDPKTVPEYAEFARSPQYQEWQRSHGQ